MILQNFLGEGKPRNKLKLTFFSILTASLLLGGCGSTDEEDTTSSVVENTAPVFTSSSSVSVAENQTSATTLSASDSNGDTLTYSISGTDASSFNINSSTGVVSFKTAPDYESQSSYSFTAIVSDGTNSTTQDISINITDIDESLITGTSKVLKTGQTKVYKDSDDGYYQKGVDRSFSRGSDVVTDNATDLQWQDDEEAKTVRKNWADAKIYCQNLNLGEYSDWRLPTYKELVNIVDFGRYNPAINPEFQNVASDYYYWSSTTSARFANVAWLVNFVSADGGWNAKAVSYYVRCVRGGQ